ncbi:MAG: hypothetical protein IH852_17780 [Bacteroidetes bacterium]|nr:hypothetical protein [Bacteroidota bacterium]
MNLVKFRKIFQITCCTFLFIVGCNISKEDTKLTYENEKIVENKVDNVKKYYSANLNIEMFPKNYSVLDNNFLFDVLPSLVDRLIFKGEFETTGEFKARIKKLDDQMHQTPIIGNLTIDSLFTMDLENANIYFDADNSIMNINIYLGRDKLWSSAGISKSEDDHIIYSKSSEIRLYDKHSPPYRSILVTNHNEYSNNSNLLTKINMDRDYARQEKENIRVIASIKLVKPWYWHRYSDIPLAKVKYIFLEVIQFWIINFKSGEIYKRIVPEK